MSGDQNTGSNLTLWIMWGAMLFSLAIYAVVLVILTGKSQNFEPLAPQKLATLRLALGGMAVIEIAAVFGLRKFLFFDKLNASDGFADLTKMRGSYWTVSILSWGLSEAVAIMGFVLSVMTHELIYYAIFAAPAVVLFILFRPKHKAYKEQFLQSRPDDATSQSDESPSHEDSAVW